MQRRTGSIHRWLASGCLILLLAGCIAHPTTAQQVILPLQAQFQLPRDAFASSLTDLVIVIGREQLSFLRQTEAHWRYWDETLELHFGWTTTQPGAVSAVYQVSTVPFPENLENAMHPPGLVASGFAGAPPSRGERRYFSIDLRTFAPVPPGDVRPSQDTTVAAPPVSPTIRTPAVKTPVSAIAVPRLLATTQVPSDYLTVVEYYVRVVTLSAYAVPVGTPSPSVKISYGELPAEGGQGFTYLGQNSLNHPSVAVSGYVPIDTEEPDAMYHYVVTHDIYVPGFDTIYHQGQHVDFTPHEHDPGFWQSLWDSIGEVYADIAGFFKSAVNWCATAYDDIKGYAIDAAVVVAGEDARAALTAGLEIGLAAMGIPPSLPNYDELTRLGQDYLIEAASDYTGLPPEVTATAVDAFLDEAARQANGGGHPDVWFKPDPACAYRPAYLTVVARNPSSERTDPVFARIDIQVPSLGDVDLFHSAYAYIPALASGETISLSVYLEENYALRDTDSPFGGESYYAGMQRFWEAYSNLPATIAVLTTGSSQSVNPTQGQQQLVLYDCRYAQSF